MGSKPLRLLRYPGGKQRQLREIMRHFPPSSEITGRYVDPFVGSAAVFFAVDPERAVLGDVNATLIDLYEALKMAPLDVWAIYSAFPATKEGYYKVRDSDPICTDIVQQAARTLFLNRTCYKGMWRHNAQGRFTVGYGGQERRWVISEASLVAASRRFQNATLRLADFEEILEDSQPADFLFLDPPYKPGERELTNGHYVFNRFSFADHNRLARALESASRRGVRWGMTTSSHIDILALFPGETVIPLQQGTGRSPGILTQQPGEVYICNYQGGH